MSGNEQEQIPEKLLQPNQRLEIMLMDGSTEVYQSRIEEVHKTELIVAMPMSKGYPVLLYEKNKIIQRKSIVVLSCCFFKLFQQLNYFYQQFFRFHKSDK